MGFQEQKNTENYSSLDIRRAQMHLNRGLGATDDVPQDLIDYVAKARGGDIEKAPVQDSNKFNASCNVRSLSLSDSALSASTCL